MSSVSSPHPPTGGKARETEKHTHSRQLDIYVSLQKLVCDVTERDYNAGTRAGEWGEETDDISDYLQCVRAAGTPLPPSASLCCLGLSKRPWPLSLSCTTYLSAFLPVPFVNICQFVVLFVVSVSI